MITEAEVTWGFIIGATMFSGAKPCENYPNSENCLDDDGTGTAGDEGVMDPGRLWCTVTPGAKWTTPNPDVSITDPLNGNGDPEACLCANQDANADLIAIDNTQSGVGAAVLAEHAGTYGNDVIEFRDDSWEAAEDRCSLLSNAHMEWADNCLTAIDKNEAGSNPKVTPLIGEGEVGDCTVGIDYGPPGYPMPSDNWDDYYTLSSVIVQNVGSGVYEIDQAFYDDMLANPAWFLNDAAYIDWNGTAFQFYSVSAGTIAAALGIQTGDKPQTLNSISVTTIEGALDAHEQLNTETTFAFVVLRGAGPVTLNYAVVP